MSLLDLRGVTKTFGGLKAINQIDLSLEKGKIFGLIGPNGAGKTTLFNVICGVYKPDRGCIYFKGRNIGGLKPYLLNKLGLARTFQIPKNFNNLTVLENVIVGSYSKAKDYDEARERALRILEFLDIKKLMDQYPYNLPLISQKVMDIGRAMASEPTLLMLDELASGSNDTEIKSIIDLLRSLKDQGITLFVIEHVMRFIMSISDWIIILQNGNKLFEGVPEEVVKDESVIRAYLGEEYVLT